MSETLNPTKFMIEPKIVNRYKKDLTGSEESIKTFFMYDADLPEVVENLKKCDGILLISNPCIEIWFIAHYKKPSEAELSSQNCVRMLKGLPNWDNYINFSARIAVME